MTSAYGRFLSTESTLSDNVILGAGIAGISAGYHWKKAGIPCVIYEKDGGW